MEFAAERLQNGRMTAAIARLKISIDAVKPKVVRRLEVPFAVRLDRLHLAFQAALGWEDRHLWAFRIGGAGFGIRDPNWPGGPHDASRAILQHVIADAGVRRFRYLYDFGDGWEHTVLIEKIEPARLGIAYPRILAAKGRCPPEDVGGPRGYGEYLEALADPHHKRHAEMIEWRGPAFDPTKVDVTEIDFALKALAQKWSRR